MEKANNFAHKGKIHIKIFEFTFLRIVLIVLAIGLKKTLPMKFPTGKLSSNLLYENGLFPT